MENNKKWLAAYLYYAEPWEKILVEAVKPFTEQMIQEGLAEHFFFIRYWERGPHIRLRFKGDANVLENNVKPQLRQYFEDYFDKKPSTREEPKWPKNTPEENKWYPNNSIQFIDYEPEIERYGGNDGIKIAEQQFEASSKAILSVIEESLDSWDYSRALGAAIQLHLGFAHSLNMPLGEMSAFFHRFFQNWLPRAYFFSQKSINQEELEKRKKETLKAFEQNFETQRNGLLPFFRTVWQALNEGIEFEQEWLNNWVSDMKEVDNLLKISQMKEKLIPPAWYMQTTVDSFSLEDQARWSIYDSYVHMINNRLGIQNRDEAYLGYLLVESIKEMSDS